MTGRRFLVLFLSSLCLCASVVNPSFAHPVRPENYDRLIEVGLTPDAVLVTYELEVNTSTVVGDLRKVLPDGFDLSTLQKPRDWYDAFLRFHVPEIARRLDAKLDGQPLSFAANPKKAAGWEAREEVSLHCRFHFKAPWHPAPGKPHTLTFRDGTYEEEAGMVKLVLLSTAAITLDEVNVPDQMLAAKALTALKPGEEEKRRQASATFTLVAAPAAEAPTSPPATAETPAPPPESAMPRPWDAKSLEELLMHRREALWLVLVVAAFLGAAHALTPGHGKTLVAAYLVGERGTIGHALLLGVLTTLSHTAGVLIVAGVVAYFFPGASQGAVRTWVGVGGGLVVAGLGAWLLLCRLTGRADHVHLGGGHGHGHGGHSHSHGEADHYHDGHGHTHALADERRRFGWWRLVVLGVTGGIIPCHDAIAIFILMFGMGLASFALPVLLAFSAGLASVLVALGMAVVYAKKSVGRHWGDSRLFKALPVLSAALVTCIGLWVCYTSLPAAPGR
jgi:ABC-type nickel/cobalt efflux system permease component RcnA